MKLKPRKFLKTVPASGKQVPEYGLIAQEVEAVEELAFATHVNDEGLKGLHYRSLDTLTLAALQDLARAVRNLAERVVALENGA